MERLEKIFTVALVIAMMGVVIFWAAGFNGHMDVAQGSLITAGVSCWVALVSIGLRKLRQRNCWY
ncbi:MAG: hypothetical protein J6L86_03055 [Alphaproteobacteria bacterium]|nr:hypothetical protein [Alphaproteobacteria bacterium]MBQ8630681.1 hypothetical protein [Alphaproteobacteria bacterium]